MAMITVKEAAYRLGVHRSAVNKAIRDRRITAVRYGRDYLIKDDEVERYRLARRQRRAREATQQ